MWKKNVVTFTKHFNYTVLPLLSNLENVIYMLIEWKIANISLRYIIQSAQLKRGNLQIIKN